MSSCNKPKAFSCKKKTKINKNPELIWINQVCPSYLSQSWRSSPSPRWSGSGTRRARSSELVLPVAGYAPWFGPDTNRDARSAAPTVPLSGLQTKAVCRSEIGLHASQLQTPPWNENNKCNKCWVFFFPPSPVETDSSVLHPAEKSWRTTVSSHPPESCQHRETSHEFSIQIFMRTLKSLKVISFTSKTHQLNLIIILGSQLQVSPSSICVTGFTFPQDQACWHILL